MSAHRLKCVWDGVRAHEAGRPISIGKGSMQYVAYLQITIRVRSRLAKHVSGSTCAKEVAEVRVNGLSKLSYNSAS